ncbi:MAG: LysR substrate-binding domain-containing protein [Pseudomonadota bacterium]
MTGTTMRDLPLTLLRSLAAVRAEGGVRPAARRLGVEHSTISRALRDLERWVGAPLVEPVTRGQPLRLTPQGEALADAALGAIGDMERATARLREASSGRRVVIAAPPSVATRWLLPRLPRLESDCRGIEVSIVVDAVRMGDLDPSADLSVRMGPRPDTKSLIHTLGDDAAFPVMGPDLWEASGRPSDIAALAGLPLLHDRDTTTAWAAWRDVIGPRDLDVLRGPRLTSADLVLRAAEQGRGVALSREWLSADALAEGRLIRPFVNLEMPLPGEWWIAQGATAPLPGPAERVRDWLLAEGKALGARHSPGQCNG